MGYLTEIDDLSKRIIYPPRGMNFEPLAPATNSDEIPQEQKPLWQQEELGFTFAENELSNPPPAT